MGRDIGSEITKGLRDMRYKRLILAASVAVVAASAFVVGATAEIVGKKFLVIDGYKYGGMLPVGADKNLDAVRVLIRAADAMGQMRDHQYAPDRSVDGYYLVLGDTTLAMRIDANGIWDGQPSHVVFDWDYGFPAVRIDVANSDKKSRQIMVAANGLAWNKSEPGIYAGPAKTSAKERLVLGYLMPSEVVLLARDAAAVMKASKDDELHDVLTIPVPWLGDGVNLVATFDTIGHPTHTEIAMGGHTYVGDFGDFLADRMDTAVNFSHHVELKVDGKEFANLDLNWHQINPYLIFPVPTEVAAK